MAQPAVGIDLGTTFSALAFLNEAGRPELVCNAEGERLTASAVYFDPAGQTLVGQLALEAAAGSPERAALWIKREMGNPDFCFSIDGRDYTPVDLSAMILKKVKQDAEKQLGPIRSAVVSVPAYFDEVRRKATMDAAKLAGLEVLRIINEPTAAALAYAVAGKVRGTVLVYDLGGGTFDVSLVRIESPEKVEVIASEGDHQLGGLDFDRALAGYCDERFFAETQQHLLTDEDRTVRRTGDAFSTIGFNTIRDAEAHKKRLSSVPTLKAVLSWEGAHLSIDVEQARFNDLISEYLVRTEMLVEDVLDEAGVSVQQVDAVLLVGGSTRIPKVKEMLQRKFGREPIVTVNQDEAVALGAALQAGLILQQQGKLNLREEAAASLGRTRLQDVTSHTFGTVALVEKHGTVKERNVHIIPKNTPIPCSKTETFYTHADGQTEIEFWIVQGDDENLEFCQTKVTGTMRVPPGRPAGRPVKITYTYDLNNRLLGEFVDVESGTVLNLTLDNADPDKSTQAVSAMDEVDFENLDIG